LTKLGGHSGTDRARTPSRRWVAPSDGTLFVAGTLQHGSDAGNGVRGLIVSDRAGVLADGTAQNATAAMEVAGVEVRAGEIIDFLVENRGNPDFDSFEWTPTLRLAPPGGGPGREFRAEADFAGPSDPPPALLTAWERYAQVLLMTNEFVYVD